MLSLGICSGTHLLILSVLHPCLWSKHQLAVPNTHHLPQQHHCRAKSFQPMIWNIKNHLIPSAGHVQTVSWDSHQDGGPRVKSKVKNIGIGEKSWSLWSSSPWQHRSDPQKDPWSIFSCPCWDGFLTDAEIRKVVSSHCHVAQTILLCIPEDVLFTLNLKQPFPSCLLLLTLPLRLMLLLSHPSTYSFLLQFPFIFCLCSVPALSSPLLELFDS